MHKFAEKFQSNWKKCCKW